MSPYVFLIIFQTNVIVRDTNDRVTIMAPTTQDEMMLNYQKQLIELSEDSELMREAVDIAKRQVAEKTRDNEGN